MKMTPDSFRKLYFLPIALAAGSGKEGDLLEACDLGQQAFADAIQAAYEDAAHTCENMGHSNGRIRASHKHVAAAIRSRAKEITNAQ